MIKLNDKELTFKEFPNGESLIDGKEILNNTSTFENTIIFKYTNDSDLIKLFLLKKHLDILNVSAKLVITYMPYSRMDRVEGTSVFTLKYISELINSLDFKSIDIIEPHSDVSTALINKSNAKFLSVDLLKEAMNKINFDENRDFVFFPDGGAEKRYSKLIKVKNQAVGFKHRNFETGKIESLQILGNIKEKGFKVIIVDDLCSFGGTFMLSAEKLKELGASEIYLVVTHCEDSIYKGKILETKLINKVFTTNSLLTKFDNNKIIIKNIF